MMYYIERPNTWRAANRKCAEIQEFVDKFKNCLIADDLSRDALVMEIRRKVAELNEAYPRCKELAVEFSHNDYISCYPTPKISDSDYVFTIKIMPVRMHYRFAENAAVWGEGGMQ